MNHQLFWRRRPVALLLGAALFSAQMGCTTTTSRADPLKAFDALEREAAQYGLLAAGAARISEFDNKFLRKLRDRQKEVIDELTDQFKEPPKPEVSEAFLTFVDKLVSFRVTLGQPATQPSDPTKGLMNDLSNDLKAAFNGAAQAALAADATEANRIDMARLRLEQVKYLNSQLEDLELLKSSPPDHRYVRMMLSVSLTAFVRPEKARAAVVYLDLYPYAADDWCHRAGHKLQDILRKWYNRAGSPPTNEQRKELQDIVGTFWDRETQYLNESGTFRNLEPPTETWKYEKPFNDPVAFMHYYLRQKHLLPKLVHVEPVDEGEIVREIEATVGSERLGFGLVGGAPGVGGELSLARLRAQLEARRLERINRLSLAFAAGNNRAGWYFLPRVRRGTPSVMKPTERRIRMVVDVPKNLARMGIHVHKVFLDESLLPIESGAFTNQITALNQARYILSEVEETFPDEPDKGIDPALEFNQRIKMVTGTRFKTSTNWRLMKSRLRNSLTQAWAEELEVLIPESSAARVPSTR